MADNTERNATSGGDSISTDDITNGVADGAKVQRVKVGCGIDGMYMDVTERRGLPVEFADRSIDAFGRGRVSSPVGLMATQLQYDLQRVYWQSDISGSGTDTHDPDHAATDIAVTASASDKVIRQSRAYLRYQPGMSQLYAGTSTVGAAVVGIDKRLGYFDDENGVFLEQNGTTALNVVLRSKVTGSVVDTKFAQASWNLDVMDGSGATSHSATNESGLTLDVTKSQILIIDLQWLAVGRVRVGFDVGGKVYYVHEFNHANVSAGAYMTTANLPVRYEIDNVTGANTGSMQCICCAVASEGGADTALGLPFHAGNEATGISVTTARPILSIRPKATFNSITNRGTIAVNLMSALSESKTCHFGLIMGGTLTGASFASVNADSLVEYDIAATAISGGMQIFGQSVSKGGSFAIQSQGTLQLFLDIAGAHPTSPYTDSLTVVAESHSTATVCTAGLGWREIR